MKDIDQEFIKDLTALSCLIKTSGKVEPIVKKLPFIRLLACGQLIFSAKQTTSDSLLSEDK